MNHLDQIKIAQRYAKALLDVAEQSNRVKEVALQLDQFKAALKNPELVAFLGNPVVTAGDKVAVLGQTLGESLIPLLEQFLKLLGEHDRLPLVGLMAEHYESLVNTRNGVVHATVSVPVSLPDGVAERFRHVLKQLYGFTDVKLTITVDPSLIAGATIRLGDKLIDGSYRGKFNLLRKQVG